MASPGYYAVVVLAMLAVGEALLLRRSRWEYALVAAVLALPGGLAEILARRRPAPVTATRA